MKSLPIFSSHYSLGQSILTLDEGKDVIEDGPDSIINICKSNNISDLYLADTNMSGFVTAYKNTKKHGIELHFGLRIVVCSDMKELSASSINTEHKIIIWAKNNDGYKRLVKMYSLAATKGFYYRPRIDLYNIEQLWSEQDLSISIPFYYSFIHRNSMYGANCLPNFNFTQPFLQVENNCIPFNFLLDQRLNAWAEQNNCNIIPTKSIYYNKKEDFLYYLAYKCLQERTTLEMPNLDHFCSNEFSVESWREENV
jgi:DNA polymerase III subunit alpha